MPGSRDTPTADERAARERWGWLLADLQMSELLTVNEPVDDLGTDFGQRSDETITSDHITRTPGVLGGKPHVKGERISVFQILDALERDCAIEEIAKSHRITPAAVRAARDYCDTHPEEVEEYRDDRDEVYESLLEQSRAPPT